MPPSTPPAPNSHASATAHFADGISVPLGGNNPRTISNLVVGAGDPDVANPEGVSAFMYAWGQFIDHDLTLTRTDGVSDISVVVPAGDPVLPAGTIIPITRAVIDPTTGPGTSNPAMAVNSNTAWLDGSMVYGSNAATAASLRTADGHMLTSQGNNLPIVNGMVVAGDVRAAENPALTALQTLFVREHNYQVDKLHLEHPNWSGDQLYNHARAIVTAEIANITYSEFLPNLVGKNALTPYDGYDPNVDPHLTLEFVAAAFRFGHSIVSGETEGLAENGEVIAGSEEDLKDVFFQPAANFIDNGGADGQLRHLAADPSQALDARIVDDLRNFLVDPPVSLDLAAINIQRARDLGLGTLNQTREALGLDPYTDFSQITSDPETLAGLKAAYGNVNNVGLWTGGLSENHVAWRACRRNLPGHPYDAVRGAARRRPVLVREPGVRFQDVVRDQRHDAGRHHPAQYRHQAYPGRRLRHLCAAHRPCRRRGVRGSRRPPDRHRLQWQRHVDRRSAGRLSVRRNRQADDDGE